LVGRHGGDFNGDGVDDIATGGPCAFANGVRRAGRVLVFSGADNSRLAVPQRHEGRAAARRISRVRERPRRRRRRRSGIGSFAWDGAGAGSNDVGKLEVRTFDGRVLVNVEGAFPAANFGEAVAALDDVNGDGVADLLVGAGDDRLSATKSGVPI
jgi:hypothetical protein